MGNFFVNGRIENLDRGRTVEVPSLPVDTDSASTWVNEKVLEGISLVREKKDRAFVMANGQQITRSIGFAILHVAATQTVDEIVFAEEGDLQSLGERSLEGLNLRVDAVAQKLMAAGPILAA